MQNNKKIALVMGSDSDYPKLKAVAETCRGFGVEIEVKVMSAHRTPDAAAKFSSTARENGVGVIIAAAGKAAHLAGVLAAHTTLPVIGIPIDASLGGLDALLATVQMPPGIPVATVGIDAAKNAALLAIQILAVNDETLAKALINEKQRMAEEVMKKSQKLQEEINK